MDPKKGRRVRKIEVPTDSVPEFELGDTAADIKQRRQERETRAREEAQQQQWREEEARSVEARAEETHSQEEGVAEKGPEQRKVTLNRGWSRGGTITVTIQEGPHDQHLSH